MIYRLETAMGGNSIFFEGFLLFSFLSIYIRFFMYKRETSKVLVFFLFLFFFFLSDALFFYSAGLVCLLFSFVASFYRSTFFFFFTTIVVIMVNVKHIRRCYVRVSFVCFVLFSRSSMTCIDLTKKRVYVFPPIQILRLVLL